MDSTSNAHSAALRPTLSIWETHGVHVGTGKDHVKHGVDDVELAVQQAIARGLPCLTFVIHSPRLTAFRYQRERDTNIKFIRGDAAYFEYAGRMEQLRRRHAGRIAVRYGVELDWHGSGLGLQWNRAKLFQAHGADFVVGSVHFSAEGIPYDGSREDTARLLALRGGLEGFWAGYLDEVIEMVDSSWQMIHVVGHLDLPKLYAPLPVKMRELEHSSHFLARRMRTLLEMVSDLDLALDVNLAGLRKGCGPFPDPQFLRRANQLGIPVALGSDAHSAEEIGADRGALVRLALEAGYRYYVSFSRGIPEKRPLVEADPEKFRVLNLGVQLLKQRFAPHLRQKTPAFSFGGSYRELLSIFPGSVSLGEFEALRVRGDERSVTVSSIPAAAAESGAAAGPAARLYSHHVDTPGTLSILFNTLASEEINVETTQLSSLADGTASAYLTVSGDPGRIREAVDFVLGTASGRFFTVEIDGERPPPPPRQAPAWLLEIDGVSLPVPLSAHMVLTVHSNRPGVLLVLLSALASRGVNVRDLQLGRRGERGFAVLGVQGGKRAVAEVLTSLGPQFHEVTQVLLPGLEGG